MADYKCCNCECVINNYSQRRTLKAKIANQKFSSEDALNNLGINVTPLKTADQHICYNCSTLIGKLSKSYTSVNELKSNLKKTSSSHSYLGFKLKRCHESPLNLKKRVKTSCTPKGKRSPVKTIQIDGQTSTPTKRKVNISVYVVVKIYD